MKTSEKINELAEALAKAQGEIKVAEKDRENPHFKSTYATLASVWDACRSQLSKNGLSVVQNPQTNGDGNLLITTMLLHSSGQFIESELELSVVQKTPQGFGSAITYGRRYALMAMVGVAPGDESEDDGNGAAPPPSKQGWTRPPGGSASAAPKVGPAPAAQTAKPAVSAATAEEPQNPRAKRISEVINLTNWPVGTVADYCTKRWGTAKFSELSDADFDVLLGIVRNQTASQARSNLQAFANTTTLAAPAGQE